MVMNAIVALDLLGSIVKQVIYCSYILFQFFDGKPFISDIDECASSPCRKPSLTTCENLPNAFKCNCGTGFTGVQCEIGEFLQCFCFDYYHGFSALDIDECLSSPCNANAQCQNLDNKWQCACNEGWTGTTCDQGIW